MEAASVPAFAALAVELSCHGAPACLVRGAERAMRDEIRHARVTARLAHRFGARATVPVVAPASPRSLAELALDNAVEGCVHETYAAACELPRGARRGPRGSQCAGRHRRRRDPARRRSWEIARWLAPRLDGTTRMRIRAAQREAVASLAAQLERFDPGAACGQAGLPDPDAAHALHGTLARELWRV